MDSCQWYYKRDPWIRNKEKKQAKKENADQLIAKCSTLNKANIAFDLKEQGFKTDYNPDGNGNCQFSALTDWRLRWLQSG